MNVTLEELSSCGLLCAALVFRMAEGQFARRSVGLTGAAVFSSLAAPSIVIPAPSVKITEIASRNPWISKFTKHQA